MVAMNFAGTGLAVNAKAKAVPEEAASSRISLPPDGLLGLESQVDTETREISCRNEERLVARLSVYSLH